MLNDAAATATKDAPEQDSQLDAARDAGATWKFEDKEYGLFVANKTGNVGIPLMHPADKTRQIGIVGADFSWSDDSVFTDHLNFQLRDEKNSRDDDTIRKSANLIRQNANLFLETVQRGWLVKIDEFGVKSDPIPKSRVEMLNYPPEVQSDIIDGWLGYFNAERYFPPGTDDIEYLLSEPDTVWIKASIGNFKNPAHVLLFEFQTPIPDARRSYESDTIVPGRRREGDTIVDTYMINNKAKLRFAKKHLKTVQGAAVAQAEALDVDLASLRVFSGSVTDPVDEFKDNFNPNWMVALADKLNSAFNYGGK